MTGSSRTVRQAFAGVTIAAAAAGLAACSSSSNSVKPAAAGASGPSQAAPAATGSARSLQTRSTSIGTVLVNSAGHTVYELVGDPASNPKCTGACLSVWPAVTANGTQVVVNGHPAFTFAPDSAPGDTKGQNVKDQWGLWLALDASGDPIQAGGGSSVPASHAPSTTTTAPNGGGAAF